jgi:hypothetical protein
MGLGKIGVKMSEPKIRFSLNLSMEVAAQLAQLLEWLNTDNATQVICRAITLDYRRVCNIKAVENMKAEIYPNDD